MDHERFTPEDHMYLQAIDREIRQSLPERLRASGEFDIASDGTKFLRCYPNVMEAADEIERLQNVISELVNEMHKIASAIHQVSAWFHYENVPKSSNLDEEPF
jgi:hypothetical protein